MTSQHDDTPSIGVQTIEVVRGAIRGLGARFPQREPIDLALGAVCAAHDLAQRAGMSPIEAIEWLRNAADLMERQLLTAATETH